MDAVHPWVVWPHAHIPQRAPHHAARLETGPEGQHPDPVPCLHQTLRLEVGQLVEHQAARSVPEPVQAHPGRLDDPFLEPHYSADCVDDRLPPGVDAHVLERRGEVRHVGPRRLQLPFVFVPWHTMIFYFIRKFSIFVSYYYRDFVMSRSGAMDLATGVGGKIKKDEVESAVNVYEKYHAHFGGDEETRKANYTDMVNKYYDLATSFYEFGWGESFHFAPRWKGESLRESIKRHEHFLALQLGLKIGMKVLDVGCGIGGPLREISRFSSVYVTGLNNNEYQITRGTELNRLAGLSNSCNFIKADFMKMPFPDNNFDAIYAIEATCHAPDAHGCYKEIYRVLKPGQCFAAYEWCMTDNYDPNNESHKKIKAEIEIGDGLPNIRSTHQCLDALKQTGFEVIWEKDLAVDSPLPWYLPLDKSHFSLSSFRLTALGRLITRTLVQALEFVRLAPAGSIRVSSFLEKAADGLVEGGRKEIFTPMYFFLARKPISES